MNRRGISKETFDKQETVEGRLSILFDLQKDTAEALQCLVKSNGRAPTNFCEERLANCDVRFKRIEKYGYLVSGGVSVVSFGTALFAVLVQFV